MAGLPLYRELVYSGCLAAAIRGHVQVAGRQGQLDTQMGLAVIFLNLAGGDCVEDLERLEQDSGFAAVLQEIERDLLSRAERRPLKRRWWRERERTVPSPSALSAAASATKAAEPRAKPASSSPASVTRTARSVEWLIHGILIGAGSEFGRRVVRRPLTKTRGSASTGA